MSPVTPTSAPARSAMVPVPPRASVRDLLRDLLGQPVRVEPGQTLDLSERRALLAAYRLDEGGPAAAMISEVPLAAGAGAAIGMMSPGEIEDPSEVTDPESELFEFYHEVANVLAKLLNSPITPHVVLRELHAVPGEVPGDLARLGLAPSARVDYRVRIGEFDSGLLTLLSA